MSNRTEYNEFLWIETGVTGAAQESDFMNGTLQSTLGSGLDFTVQTFVGTPAGIETEEQLRDYLATTLQKIVDLNLEIAFDVQVGPAGDGESDDDA
jgi:hypothetical protein